MKHIIGIASVVFLASCSGKSADKTDKNTELDQLKKQRVELNSKITKLEAEVGATTKTPAKDVTVYETILMPFKNYVEIQGRVDAEENVQVNPEAQGVVTAVYARIGQNVSKGQVLAQIDDKVLSQNLAELQTQLDLANNLYRRQKNLWDQKIGTEVQFINAKNQKESAERRIATLKSQAATYKIKAPISGVVDQMDLKVGQSVTPGASNIRVVNANNLKVKAEVAESYSGKITEGDDVKVIFPDIPDTLNTKLFFASRTIDAASRSFNVEVKLPSKRFYRPNMIAILNIVDYKKDKAIVIPVNAIQKAESGDYVYIAQNGKAKRVTVKQGKVYDSKAEILSGLKAGDKVITAGIQDLNEDDAVKFN